MAADGPGPLLRGVLALLLCLLTALPWQPAMALGPTWRRGRSPERAEPVGLRHALQEVSPPEGVQQLQQALAGRQPVVEILSPQDDTLLGGEPWTLKLRVHDWPLVDAGELGLGPHLVVQLDDEPPRRWTRTEGPMPALRPGSHRLTVYAAQPWGEARKNPGAWQQIRLHRTAANPLAVPARGTPQLVAVSPAGGAAEDPLLVDWLLLDAPLQNLGSAGIQWRLRLTINGEDTLLDQQTPLWLRGWKPGENALQLQLLDGRGNPLNPPFNSLVEAVERSPAAASPPWREGPLSAGELAILIGEAPPEPPQPAPGSAPAAEAPSLPAPTHQSPEPGAPLEPAPATAADKEADNTAVNMAEEAAESVKTGAGRPLEPTPSAPPPTQIIPTQAAPTGPRATQGLPPAAAPDRLAPAQQAPEGPVLPEPETPEPAESGLKTPDPVAPDQKPSAPRPPERPSSGKAMPAPATRAGSAPASTDARPAVPNDLPAATASAAPAGDNDAGASGSERGQTEGLSPAAEPGGGASGEDDGPREQPPELSSGAADPSAASPPPATAGSQARPSPDRTEGEAPLPSALRNTLSALRERLGR